MKKMIAVCLAMSFLLIAAGQTLADITVRNASNVKIEVQIDMGSKSTIDRGQSVVFNKTPMTMKVKVFVNGFEKASVEARDRDKLKVVDDFGTWSIQKD